MRTLIANRSGYVLGEIEPSITSIPFLLNGISKITVSVPKAQATKTLLKYGNFIVFLFENGLPPWAGPIMPPREWTNGFVAFDVYSAEMLLKYRVTGKNKIFVSKTVGQIFTGLINEANSIFPTRVTLGDVWEGGNTFTRDYHYQSILDILVSDLSKLATADFDVKPVFDYAANRVSFTANYYERKGSKKPQIALIEDHNILDATRREQGPIINKWYVAGSGNTWDSTRPTVTVQDNDSVSQYEVLEDSKIFSDMAYISTLTPVAQNLLDQSKQPVDRWDLVVGDMKPALLADYDVGDSVLLDAPTYDFDGYRALVRILAREYSPENNQTVLIADYEEDA